MRPTRQITIVTDLSCLSSREFLTGVLQYARDKHDWDLRVLQSPRELTPRVVREIGKASAAGLITTEIPSKAVSNALSAAHFPVVLVGTRECAIPGRQQNFIQLSIDESNIGRRAAEHLMSFGRFRSCAFVPTRQPLAQMLSRLRERAFLQRCAHSVTTAVTFRNLGDGEFAQRLASLPRPIGILAETAERGQLVLRTASRIGLAIPSQCALVAIESDSLVCSAMTPHLTNVYPDATGEGLEAARRMDFLLRRKSDCPRMDVLINVPILVQERESTTSVSPAAALIQRATELIDKEAAQLATAEDLAARLGVSRRLLDLRLSDAQQETAAALLREAKLAAFAERLRESRLSVASLAAECGFPNASYLQTLFKRRYGTTPGAYRRRPARA